MVYSFCPAQCSVLPQLTAQKHDIPADWLSFTDTAYNFSIRYPADWEFKLKNTNTRFFVTSSLENSDDKFRENINCIARVIEEKGITVKIAEDAKKNRWMINCSGLNT